MIELEQNRIERGRRRYTLNNSGFREEDHPRSEDGKFGQGGGAKVSDDPAIVNLPLSKRGDIDKQIDAYKKQQAEIKMKKEKETVAQYKQTKELAKTLKEQYADMIIDRMKGKAKEREVRNLLDEWVKNDPNRMILAVDKLLSEKKGNSIRVYRARS